MKQLQFTKRYTSQESKALTIFLRSLDKNSKPISAEEEVRLARLIHNGDKVAEEKLIVANLRFVVSVAKQYEHGGLELGDLINEGNVGLIKAAKRFDETRGFKFISYAVWWIRQSIMKALNEEGKLVRLPVNKTTAYGKIDRIVALLEQQLERMPMAEEVCDYFNQRGDSNINELEVTLIMNKATKHSSLDALISEDGDFSLLSILSDNSFPSPDHFLLNESLQQVMLRVVNTTFKRGSRENLILQGYFGLGNNTPRELEELAEELDLTRERVRQIKETALRTLRKNSRVKRWLKTYLS